MTQFLQLHILTSYPPSNVNRDDLGRPKSVIFGGTQRLRISSQSLKRAWRTAPSFQERLQGNLGIRTKEIGHYVEQKGKEFGIAQDNLKKIAQQLVVIFGGDKKEEKKDKDQLKTAQLVFIGAHELQEIDKLLKNSASRGKLPAEEEVQMVLKKSPGGADVAMFGRMLASAQDYNVEAAVQVAHAITVHKVTLEDDYFTAVDDLQNVVTYEGAATSGAAHIDVNQFGAGVFYQYICIDIDRLKKNLNDDLPLAKAAIEGLIEASVTTSPSGKQNSYAHGSYASYVLAEKGTKQPRSLSSSYLAPIQGTDILAKAIEQLRNTMKDFNVAYGDNSVASVELVVPERKGTLAEVLKFASSIE